MKHKKLVFGLGIPFVVVLSFAVMVFRPAIPHTKAQLILPFASEYDHLTGLIPMGETKFHPKPGNPHGHPGIDFGGEERFPLIAGMDGTVTSIDSNDPQDSQYDIVIQSGAYQLRYFEVDDAAVTKGQKVKQGDLVAYLQKAGGESTNETEHYTTHWEFGSSSPIFDRWCPLTYFTAESLARINAIWDRVDRNAYQGIKSESPSICSGDYEGRVEPDWMLR